MGDSLAKVLLGGEKKKLPWDFFNQKEILSINLIPRYKSKIIKELKPMFIATLFTIAKRWKQLKCPIDEWMETKCGHTYGGVLFSLKKEGNSDTCDSMDGP